jgi:hypothetical protein
VNVSGPDSCERGGKARLFPTRSVISSALLSRKNAIVAAQKLAEGRKGMRSLKGAKRMQYLQI